MHPEECKVIDEAVKLHEQMNQNKANSIQAAMSAITEMTEAVIGRSENDARPCLIFADDKIKMKWDLFIIVLLLVVCIIIPWRLAFSAQEPVWEVIYYLVDFLFLADILLTFITTIPDKEKMVQITDRC